MQRVIFDTNFFLIPGEFGIDVISEVERICNFPYQLATLDGVVRELEGLSKEKGKAGMAARIGVEIFKKFDFDIIDSASLDLDVDGAIIKIARPGEDIVASQDKEVISLLREKGVATINMRQRRYLQLRRT